MNLFGCGDIYVAKRLPRKSYNGFEKVKKLIKAHDACFANLETTIHDNEGYPSGFPGGGYAMASPRCLDDLKQYGFNIFNIANNHALDYSIKGLEATIKYLKEADISYIGAGMNLAEAANPKYIESREGRIAFIGATSSFHDSDAAGPAGGIIPGRPGVNPLRRKEYYYLNPELFRAAEMIAEATGMNDGHKWAIANGYKNESNDLSLRDLHFLKSESNGRITIPLEEDIERIKKAIREASIQADVTIVSFHSHQMDGTIEKPAQFIKTFCYECIDAGATVIFGHGVHEIRGLEIYNGCPIFYGLGDFVLHNEMQELLPREFYDKMGVCYTVPECVGMAMNIRSEGQTKGLQATPKAWEAIGASISFEKKKIKEIRIYPFSLGYNMARSTRGWPFIDKTGTILESFISLSNEYGTIIRDNDGVGKVVI